MKNIIISIMILFVFIPTVAQQYESCFGEESTSYYSVFVYSFDGDITTEEFPFDYNKYIIYSGIEFISINGTNYYIGQNDENDLLISLKKVSETNYELDTIMNLNLEIGDSILLKNNRVFNQNYAHVVDVSINNGKKIIEFDADYFLQTYPDTLSFRLKYIEGVGPNFGPSFNSISYFPEVVSCFFKDGIKTYMDSVFIDCIYQYSGVQNKLIQKSELEYANGYYHIPLPNANSTIYIYDCIGKLRNCFNITGEEFIINEAELIFGLNVLIVKDRNNKIIDIRRIYNLNS